MTAPLSGTGYSNIGYTLDVPFEGFESLILHASSEACTPIQATGALFVASAHESQSEVQYWNGMDYMYFKLVGIFPILLLSFDRSKI